MNPILSLLNWRAQEENRFTSIFNQGPFELRLYSKLVCAKILTTGTNEYAFKTGLKELLAYLKGNNFKLQQIKNTGLFFQIPKGGGMDVSIILPAHLTFNSAPKPVNRFVKIEEMPPTKVGVLRFKGIASTEMIHFRGEELKHWLASKGLESHGATRLSLKEESFPFSLIRFHEVQREVVA